MNPACRTRLLLTSGLLALLGACSPEAPPAEMPDAARSPTPDAGSVVTDAAAIDDAAMLASPDATADAPIASDAPMLGGSCPPGPPFGRAVGDTAPDVTLTDCDGGTHSLHALCERDAVWIFELADWCPPCRAFARDDANRIYDRFQSEAPGRFEGWVVISEDASFNPATSATCTEIRDRYGLHAPVLFDTEGRLQEAFGVAPNEVHIVLGRGGEIRFVGHYAGSMVEAEIASALE